MVPSVKSQNFEGLFSALKKKSSFFLSVTLHHVKNYPSQFPKCSYFTFSAVFLQLILYTSAYNEVVLVSLLLTRFAISNTTVL